MHTQESISGFRAQPFPGDFTKRLKVLEQLTGLSWKQLAACLGVSLACVMRWRGGVRPRAGFVVDHHAA